MRLCGHDVVAFLVETVNVVLCAFRAFHVYVILHIHLRAFHCIHFECCGNRMPKWTRWQDKFCSLVGLTIIIKSDISTFPDVVIFGFAVCQRWCAIISSGVLCIHRRRALCLFHCYMQSVMCAFYRIDTVLLWYKLNTQAASYNHHYIDLLKTLNIQLDCQIYHV